MKTVIHRTRKTYEDENMSTVRPRTRPYAQRYAPESDSMYNAVYPMFSGLAGLQIAAENEQFEDAGIPLGVRTRTAYRGHLFSFVGFPGSMDNRLQMEALDTTKDSSEANLPQTR